MTEEHFQRELLQTEIGVKGSGMTRYAAAMYFYQHGKLSSKTLEIYRVLAKDDCRDPNPILHEINVK